MKQSTQLLGSVGQGSRTQEADIGDGLTDFSANSHKWSGPWGIWMKWSESGGRRSRSEVKVTQCRGQIWRHGGVINVDPFSWVGFLVFKYISYRRCETLLAPLLLWPLLQISMYEDKMTRLRQEQKRLQQLNSQSEDEVKAVSHLWNELVVGKGSVTLFHRPSSFL